MSDCLNPHATRMPHHFLMASRHRIEYLRGALVSRNGDPPAERWLVGTVCGGFDEPFDQESSVRCDHLLRGDVVDVGGEIDVGEVESDDLSEQLAQSSGGVSPPPSPGNDRVADVAQDVGRQFGRSGLPPEPDAADETVGPHPSLKTRQPADLRSVREHDGITSTVRVVQFLDERDRVGVDPCQLLVVGVRVDGVWTPTLRQRLRVALEVADCGNDEIHLQILVQSNPRLPASTLTQGSSALCRSSHLRAQKCRNVGDVARIRTTRY